MTRIFAFLLAGLVSLPAFAQGICPYDVPPKIVTGTTYTIAQSDYCNLIIFTNSGTVAVTLPAPGTRGGYTAGFWTQILAWGPTVTVTPAANAAGSTPTINGGSSLSRTTTLGATIHTGPDGNYYATLN